MHLNVVKHVWCTIVPENEELESNDEIINPQFRLVLFLYNFPITQEKWHTTSLLQIDNVIYLFIYIIHCFLIIIADIAKTTEGYEGWWTKGLQTLWWCPEFFQMRPFTGALFSCGCIYLPLSYDELCSAHTCWVYW